MKNLHLLVVILMSIATVAMLGFAFLFLFQADIIGFLAYLALSIAEAYIGYINYKAYKSL